MVGRRGITDARRRGTAVGRAWRGTRHVRGQARRGSRQGRERREVRAVPPRGRAPAALGPRLVALDLALLALPAPKPGFRVGFPHCGRLILGLVIRGWEECVIAVGSLGLLEPVKGKVVLGPGPGLRTDSTILLIYETMERLG